MPRRKMPANGKASNGASLLYDSNAATDHNNNHLLSNNSPYQENSESNERNSNNNSHSSTSRSSPNHIKKELSDYNDLNADANSSQCAEEDIINEEEEEEPLNDDLEIDEEIDNELPSQLNSKTRSLLVSGSKLNGAPQSSPLSMPFTNEQLDKHAKLLNQLTSLSKSESLIKNSNKPSDGDSILENFNNFNNLTSLTNLNNLGNLSALNLSNILGSNLTFNQNDNYGVLNANEEDDEDSSNNMVITPDIGDYASYQDDDLDDSPTLNLNQIKQNLATSLDDEEELDSDLLGNECSAKDDREGCRSLICDSNGIIIAEMVYRCMVCANISDSITDAQRHYQLKHIFNQNLGLGNNSPLNNSYNWKANNNSANSSRSSNSSLAQMRQHHLLKKQLANQHQKLQRMQQLKMQQQRIHMQRIQAQKLKEQKLQKANQQRLLALQQQNQFQQQLQQNQRLEQLRQQQQQQQQLNDQLAQMQSNSESSPQQQIQQNINSVPDVNSLFLNPPLPGTVSKTPQSSHGSSRGGYVTCAVCSITKFYASVQRRYGQFTCMGCAKFFGRFLAKPKKFNCPNLGSCALNTSPRCKACLLLACINTYTIDEKRKMVVNANRPVQRPGGPTNLIGRASDSAKRKNAVAKV